MTEVEKKVGKTKISLIVSVALVVILVVSNVWFYNKSAKPSSESKATL